MFYGGNCVKHRLCCHHANEQAPALNVQFNKDLISSIFINASTNDISVCTHVVIVYQPSCVDQKKAGIHMMMITVFRLFFLFLSVTCVQFVYVCFPPCFGSHDSRLDGNTQRHCLSVNVNCSYKACIYNGQNRPAVFFSNLGMTLHGK